MKHEARNWREKEKKYEPGGPRLGPNVPLGLALSGGGHRASLFGLGVLMAMRDAGKEPEQISSVSGGSIPNAFLAYNYFAKVNNKEEKNDNLWEQETLRLFETIVTKGVLTKKWICFLLSYLIVPPIVFVISALFDKLPPWQVTIPIAVVWATILILRGMLIEWLISRRYFGGLFRVIDFSSFSHSKPEHVICCTDLVTGRPLYASTHCKGQIFRSFKDQPVGAGPRTFGPAEKPYQIEVTGVKYCTPNLSVATAVRASAGFPGIPPRRLQLNKFYKKTICENELKDVSSLAFLSDGGIWSNLATQPFEDRFLGVKDGPYVVVVADASASLEYEKPTLFHFPGIAEILALVRQAVIQSINTVVPRKMSYQDGIRREFVFNFSARSSSERLYPVVSCMETPEEIKVRLGSAANATTLYTSSDQEQKAYIEELRAKTQGRVEHIKRPTGAPDPTSQIHCLDPEAPKNFRCLCSLAFVEEKTEGISSQDPVSSYPTTLGKIDQGVARAIVGRGYANTAITLYLTGLADKLVFPKGWLSGREKNKKQKNCNY